MKQMQKALLCATLLGSMTCMARASLTPHANVAGLTTQSDLVIKGRITQFLRYSVSAKTRWAITIQVDQVLKGSLDGPRASITVQPSSLGKYANISNGEYGIFFLTKSGSSTLDFADANFPRIVGSPNRSGEEVSASDLGRVAQDISDVLRLPTTSAGDIGGGVADDVRLVGSYRVLQDGSTQLTTRAPSHTRIAEDTYMHAVSALRTMPPEIRIAALKDVANAKAGGLGRTWAAGELLRLGDGARLPETVAFLINHAPSDSLTATMLDQDVRMASIPAEQADSLYLLLKAKDVEVRRVAVHALGRIVAVTSDGAERRTQTLAGLLGDADALVRLEAAEAVCSGSDRCEGLDIRQLAAANDLGTVRALANSSER